MPFGWGDIFPTTGLGKAFCFISSFVGIPVTIKMVFTGAELITAHIKDITHLLKRTYVKTRRHHTHDCYDDDSDYHLEVAIGHVLLLLSYLLLVSCIFMSVGNFSFVDCIFDVFMGMTSIGISESIPRFILDIDADESKLLYLLILIYCWVLFGSMVIMATVMYLVNFRVECRVRLRSKRYNVAKIDKEIVASSYSINHLDTGNKSALLVSLLTVPQHDNNALGVKRHPGDARKPKMSVSDHSNCTHR